MRTIIKSHENRRASLEVVPTDSPKCLLTLPPKGWKPESRILPRPGLLAGEYLDF